MSVSVRVPRGVGTPSSRGRDRVRSAASGALNVAIGLVLVVLTGLLLRGGLPTDPAPTLVGLTGGAGNATHEQLAATSADVLEDATKSGGSGYRFEIIQTSTMVAKAGGPRIPVPASTGRGTARLTDRYYLHAIIEQGVARPDGFWSQMRAGPAEGAKPDWTTSEIMFEALVRDGERWRNDGDGWYQAAALPGVGLDPATAALLPDLLRGTAQTAKDLPADDVKVDPSAVRAIEASATAADIPGVVAADGLAFTRVTGPIAYGFDEAGRVISIRVPALNTNMTDFDLVIETVIELSYDGVDGLPEPKPVMTEEGN